MGAWPCLLSCITCETLSCIFLTLPTVWRPHTSWSAIMPISVSPDSAPRPPTFPSCSLLSFLSLAYSLSCTCFLTHSISLSLSHLLLLSPNLSYFLLICQLSHCCPHPPSPMPTFSLCVLTPWGKWRYVNCFLLDVCPACYLSILMNSFPHFSPEISELQH